MKHKFLSCLFFSSVLVLFTACKKEKDTIAIIQVRDTNNMAIENAKVVLYGNPDYQLGEIIRMDTAITDLEGQATFNYTEAFKLGQTGFAILEVRAQKGNLEGTGSIHIKEEETTYETIVIQP